MALPQRKTDIGPPHYEQFLPPVIKKNYGKWKYHEILKPGVMVHVSETGAKLFTVRAGSPRPWGYNACSDGRWRSSRSWWRPPCWPPATPC